MATLEIRMVSQFSSTTSPSLTLRLVEPGLVSMALELHLKTVVVIWVSVFNEISHRTKYLASLHEVSGPLVIFNIHVPP